MKGSEGARFFPRHDLFGTARMDCRSVGVVPREVNVIDGSAMECLGLGEFFVCSLGIRGAHCDTCGRDLDSDIR